jgi:hypothetical protein
MSIWEGSLLAAAVVVGIASISAVSTDALARGGARFVLPSIEPPCVLEWQYVLEWQ